MKFQYKPIFVQEWQQVDFQEKLRQMRNDGTARGRKPLPLAVAVTYALLSFYG